MIDPHVPFKQRRVGLHQCARLVNAGVVDQAIQSAQRRRYADRLVPILLPDDILSREYGGLARLRCQSPALRLMHVADHDACAFSDEQPRFGGTLSARAAANQDDLTFEPIKWFLLGRLRRQAVRPTVSPCRDRVTWKTFRRGSTTGRYRCIDAVDGGMLVDIAPGRRNRLRAPPPHLFCYRIVAPHARGPLLTSLESAQDRREPGNSFK